VIEMTPAQLHIHFEVEFSAGLPPIVTVGEPGAQGPEVTGMQGWGVKTPSAAAVAAATCGLAKDVHIPNVGMLLIGAKSMIVAAGVVHVVVGAEVAMSEAGAAPKVHCIIAPVTTSCAITMTLLSFIKEFQQKSFPDCQMQDSFHGKLNNKDAKARRKKQNHSVFASSLFNFLGSEPP
jgi:hypothetical protein